MSIPLGVIPVHPNFASKGVGVGIRPPCPTMPYPDLPYVKDELIDVCNFHCLIVPYRCIGNFCVFSRDFLFSTTFLERGKSIRDPFGLFVVHNVNGFIISRLSFVAF